MVLLEKDLSCKLLRYYGQGYLLFTYWEPFSWIHCTSCLNIACFVYFYRNNDGSGFVVLYVLWCTWIWLESWYRLRPYSTLYHISILDVLYVAPFNFGCYVLCQVPLSGKNLLLSYHCQNVLLFCWEFLVELNAAIFMRYKINSFHYIIKASVYSVYFNVEMDTVIIFSLIQNKHRQCHFQVVNENVQWLSHAFWVFKCSYLQSPESLGAYYNNCGYLCDCHE